jgi:hypothetical protein
MVIGGVATLVLFLAVVIVLARTGGAKAVSVNAAVIGALVALGGVFTAQMVSIALDDRRTQEARNIERQRAQDDASQAYLDQMSFLLLDKDRPLHQSREGDAARTLARARTLTVLSRLDGDRKQSVVQFLYESDLITKDHVVVDLSGADLREADLSNANLSGAGELTELKLRGALLSYADLSFTDLSRALRLTEEQLEHAETLEGATMPNGQKYEDWLKSKGRGRMGRTPVLRNDHWSELPRKPISRSSVYEVRIGEILGRSPRIFFLVTLSVSEIRRR